MMQDASKKELNEMATKSDTTAATRKLSMSGPYLPHREGECLRAIWAKDDSNQREFYIFFHLSCLLLAMLSLSLPSLSWEEGGGKDEKKPEKNFKAPSSILLVVDKSFFFFLYPRLPSSSLSLSLPPPPPPLPLPPPPSSFTFRPWAVLGIKERVQ